MYAHIWLYPSSSYCLLVVTFLLTFYVEFTTLPRMYLPGIQYSISHNPMFPFPFPQQIWLVYHSLPFTKMQTSIFL